MRRQKGFLYIYSETSRELGNVSDCTGCRNTQLLQKCMNLTREETVCLIM